MDIKSLFKRRETGILSVIILLSIIITSINSVFISPGNILDIIRNSSIIGIVALGVFVVILSGEIDVSTGSLMAAVTVIIGTYMVKFTGNIFTVLLIGCGSGVILGLVNGFFVSKINIPSIVVTLGTKSLIIGVVLYFTNGAWITNLPTWFMNFSEIKIFGLSIPILLFILMSVLTYFLVNYTLLGRGIYALGGNPETASRVGFKIDKIKLFVFSYVGFMVGIAAIAKTSIVKMVNPNAFSMFELDVIGAVVLGGTNIMGGSGTVSGTILGVLLMGVIDNGLILARVPTFWQQVVVGMVIIGAVSLDAIKEKRKEKNKTKIMEV